MALKDRNMHDSQFLRDLDWVESFEPGTAWRVGSFRPKREAELVAAGVLVLDEHNPSLYRTARRPRTN